MALSTQPQLSVTDNVGRGRRALRLVGVGVIAGSLAGALAVFLLAGRSDIGWGFAAMAAFAAFLIALDIGKRRADQRHFEERARQVRDDAQRTRAGTFEGDINRHPWERAFRSPSQTKAQVRDSANANLDAQG